MPNSTIEGLPAVSTVSLTDVLPIDNTVGGTTITRKITVGELRGEYVTPQDFGAVGDGSTDDTVAVAAAIATGKSVYFGGVSSVYRVTSTLSFNQDSVQYFGENASLLFDGANTTRLLDVEADDVTFVGLVFNGGDNQPSGAMCYLDDNSKRVKFHNCIFKNLTGTATGSNTLNNMYAVLISPYGVQDFEFVGCTFTDIIKYNNTAVVGTPTTGWGFCGGIFAGIRDTFAAPTDAQPIPSCGVIDNCVFDDIRTIIDVGSSTSNRSNFDDADAIRFFGDDAGANKLPVRISNCIFRKVSKRAIKGSVARGVQIDNTYIDASGLDMTMYTDGMWTGIKVDSDMQVRGLIMKAGASAARSYICLQVQGYQNALMDGIYCDFVQRAYVITPEAAYNLKNIELHNAVFDDCSVEGYRMDVVPTTMANIGFHDVRFTCSGTTSVGFRHLQSSSGTLGGLVVRGLYVKNGYIKIQGINNDIDGVLQEITSNTYVGANATIGLFENGVGAGVGGWHKMRNVSIEAAGIKTDFIQAGAPYLALLYADNMDIDNFKLKVPDGMAVTYPHGVIYGSDIQADGLTYDGPGKITAGNLVASTRIVMQNVVRTGSGACSETFLQTGLLATDDIVLMSVTDYRPTTAASITIDNAGTNYVVSNLVSNSSNTQLVADAGNKCGILGARRIAQTTETVSSATTTTLPTTGDVFIISGTNNITSVTASYPNRRVTLIFEDVLTFTDGNNLVLSGNFSTSTDDCITLVCNGTNWYEVARSAN